MVFKPRALARTVSKAIKTFPVVVLTGPRQSGKTTLLRKLFSKTHRLVSLEDVDVRLRAREDPLRFLNDQPPPVVLDEIQYVPELLSFIKTRVDETRKPGQWILSGSQHFALMQNVTQSLAGRAAVLSLLPFSCSERVGNGEATRDFGQWIRNPIAPSKFRLGLEELLLRGDYPEIASRRSVDRQLWCGSYLTTYLERDVRSLAQVGDLHQFERFLRLCATRTAELANFSRMARDVGVSVSTAKRWISMLETGYQVVLLYPYYRNIGKRLVKSPKLYFTDTGVASYLLGLHDRAALTGGPSFGPLFETLVVTDFLKRFVHAGQHPPLYFLQSRDGLEVDLVVEEGGGLHLLEVKTAMTITSKHASSLRRLKTELGARVKTASLISCSPSSFTLPGGINNYNWKEVLLS